MIANLDPAVSLRFKVVIDGHHDLGTWTKCDGLSVEYEVQDYKEGGENTYVHRLPGRTKYQNIKLTRPVDATSTRVAQWLSSVSRQVRRQTADISVMGPDGKPLARWSLEGVYPVRWTGPSLDTSANQFASEVLELAHNGFLGG